jgi:hypothetical protein
MSAHRKSKPVTPAKALAALRAGLRTAFELEGAPYDDSALLAEAVRCGDIARRAAMAAEVEQVIQQMLARTNGSLTRNQCIEVLKRRGEWKFPR